LNQLRTREAPNVPAPDTKSRILDSAEFLFAERGIEPTSLRAVTTRAGINLAAVHYHFGSKDALIAAVVERRVGPINQERLKLLERLEVASKAPPSVEPILQAFFGPAVRALANSDRGSLLAKMMSRIYWESGGETRQLILEQFRDVLQGFIPALSRSLPELPIKEVAGRFQFGIGVMVHALSQRGGVSNSPFPMDFDSDPERQLARMVSFVAAGFRAEVPDPPEARSSGGAS
jgi:AcrR family transcriptional regulator